MTEDAMATDAMATDGAHDPRPDDTPPPHSTGAPSGGVGALHERLAEAVDRGEFGGSAGHAALLAVPVTLRAVLGQARLPVSRFLALDAGDTLTLDRAVGEPVDVTVNDTVIARAEIVMLDEDAGTLGVRVTELVAA